MWKFRIGHIKRINPIRGNKKENIAFTTFRCNTWQDCGRIIPFSNKSEKQLEHQFTNCCNSDLISLLHGKLYRCPFSANGVNLNAIPQNKTDEVDLINDDLSIAETKKQIKQYKNDGCNQRMIYFRVRPSQYRPF